MSLRLFNTTIQHRTGMGQSATLLVVVAILGTMIAGFVGWGMNIIDLFQMTEFSGKAALRVVGIFVFPIGMILGYL